MIELQTSVKQDDTTRTRTPKPGYLNLSNDSLRFVVMSFVSFSHSSKASYYVETPIDIVTNHG